MRIRHQHPGLRGLALGALMLAMAAPVSAQQVHVFSDGKPYTEVDPGNAARKPVADERKLRRPLAERPDATAIATAHAAAFLHCGFDESGWPAAKAPVPEELDYFVKDAGYIPIPGNGKIIVIGEYGRGKAVVETGKLTVVTPQCPAGVRTLFWSPAAERIVFATQHVDKLEFHGDSRALWTAKYAPAQDLHLLDAAQPEAGLHKLMSLPGEKVLDVLLPEKADHLWVLSQTDKLDLRSPRKLMRALSRDPARKMDIYLRKVDLHGRTLEQITVAKGVAAGTAHFVRQ
jgi:hypothetical protein